MPLTPEDTLTQAGAEDAPESKDTEQSNSRMSGWMNSRYLKPVGAVLLALGAGYLVRFFRNRENTPERKKKA